MRDSCISIADELIFGKEISNSVKCFLKKHKNKRFGFMILLQCEKKNRCTVLRNTRDHNARSICACIGGEIRITAFCFFLALILATWVNLWEWTTHCWLLPMAQSAGWRLLSSRVRANSVSVIFRSTSSSAGSSLRPGLTAIALCVLCQKKLKSYRTILVNYTLWIKVDCFILKTPTSSSSSSSSSPSSLSLRISKNLICVNLPVRTSSKSHAMPLWKTALNNAKYFKRSISTFNTAWHTVRLNVEACVTSLIKVSLSQKAVNGTWKKSTIWIQQAKQRTWARKASQPWRMWFTYAVRCSTTSSTSSRLVWWRHLWR